MYLLPSCCRYYDRTGFPRPPNIRIAVEVLTYRDKWLGFSIERMKAGYKIGV